MGEGGSRGQAERQVWDDRKEGGGRRVLVMRGEEGKRGR